MTRRESELSEDRARELVARVWSDAQEATGTSNCDLARAWGCDEKVARNVRAGLAALTGSKVRRAPRRQGLEFLRRLTAELAGEAPTSCLTPEGQAQVVLGDAGEAVAALARALPGGIDASESREVLVSLRRLMRAGRELEAQLERVAHGALPVEGRPC